MTLRKISTPEEDRVAQCRDPGHRLPSHIVLENGVYEWTCPGCGGKTTFRVSQPTL